MANFSLDYGNAHWTVLDANATVDWTDRRPSGLGRQDLAAAKGDRGGSSASTSPDSTHRNITSTSSTCGFSHRSFEAGKVDLVFNGHVHNYQRTYPMTFVPAKENGAKPVVGPDGKAPKTGTSMANGRSTRSSTASRTRPPKV